MRPIDLADDEVHVWRVALDALVADAPALYHSLPTDERARADRFVFDRHRWAYVAGRAALRALLAEYVGVAPDRLRFRYSAAGKPDLADPPAPIRFNLSHSGDVALVAITLRLDVGVDVERVERERSGDDVAERFFAQEELEALRQLPSDSRVAGFFSVWTLKEAYIKALGDGLSHPLDSFSVEPVFSGRSRLLRADGDDPSAWTLHTLDPGPGYAGAVAVRARDVRVASLDWNPDVHRSQG